ncbi:hypothetical protein BJ742DRAFT_268369 [Cladochytrium replicatum]|nr:hypothetical protein BJ742DRAFT_268369 [Cladochytrium replicatum]
MRGGNSNMSQAGWMDQSNTAGRRNENGSENRIVLPTGALEKFPIMKQPIGRVTSSETPSTGDLQNASRRTGPSSTHVSANLAEIDGRSDYIRAMGDSVFENLSMDVSSPSLSSEITGPLSQALTRVRRPALMPPPPTKTMPNANPPTSSAIAQLPPQPQKEKSLNERHSAGAPMSATAGRSEVVVSEDFASKNLLSGKKQETPGEMETRKTQHEAHRESRMAFSNSQELRACVDSAVQNPAANIFACVQELQRDKDAHMQRAHDLEAETVIGQQRVVIDNMQTMLERTEKRTLALEGRVDDFVEKNDYLEKLVQEHSIAAENNQKHMTELENHKDRMLVQAESIRKDLEAIVCQRDRLKEHSEESKQTAIV